MAAKRFLADLKRAEIHGSPFKFERWQACDVCDFIEKLPHVEGTWEKDTLVLHPSQVFFLVQLFGFRNARGGRRFTSAIFAVARKNGKSSLAAAILLYCFCCEQEKGPQVISAATTGSQARIVWNVAKRMVERTADLREAFTLEAFANSIARYESGGSFKPINAKASTQDGLNPSHVELDEIHAHKTHDLLNVLRSAAGARENPLFLFTTTEGYENPGPWSELRHFTKQLLEEAVEADHFLALYYAVDDADDDYDEKSWVKANPLLEVNAVLAREIAKEAIEAKAMPGRAAEFRIKRLNRQSAPATAWINLEKWKQGGTDPLDLDWLSEHECWGAIDLASTTDLASARLLWRVDDMFYTWGRRFVPAQAAAQRTIRGTVPYAAWIEAKLIEQTEGDVTDYAYIESAIHEMNDRFRPKQWAFDRWNASDLVSRLMASELPMIEFIQGPRSYHPAAQALERAYLAGNLRHGGDPVLQWCASNLVMRYDANMNMAPDKKRSSEKIDDMSALLMAFGLSAAETESCDFMPDDYELMVV